MKKTLGTLVIIIGLISSIIFFIAGNEMSKASKNMQDIRSVSGTSVAEAYYHEVGGLSKGLGMLSNAMGFGVIALSMGLGGRIMNSENYSANLENNNVEKKQEEIKDLGKLGL
jgi:hypothetical protein